MAITRLTHLYVFLTFALTAISQAPTCEELAKQAGKPTDGWKIVSNSNGDQQCQRVTVDEMCLGQQYTDPVAGNARCCSPPHTLTWTDKANNVGHCCPAGQVWTNGECNAAPPNSPGDAPSAPPSGTSCAPTGLASIPASTFTQFNDFGTNPNNVAMFVYRPKNVVCNPPLIVANHGCGGTGPQYFTVSKFAQLSETYGYVVIFPSSPHPGTCWDVSSDETLTHNGGSDSLSIANAARFAISNWGVDPHRVFAVGTSSGAMMTSVLAGAYPDVFKAGIVDSGVPFGCYAMPGQPVDSWNWQCSTGELILTGAEWAAKVKAAFPGFSGTYPRMQVWHGTIDNLIFPQNFWEQVKQWTTVFGYSSTPVSNVTVSYLPSGSWNATFGPHLQAILAQNVGHSVPLFEQQYLEFFGIA